MADVAISLSLFESVDLYLKIWLSVTVFLEISRFLLIFDDSELWSTSDLYDSACNLCLVDERSADSSVRTVVHEKNLVKNDLIPFFVVEFRTSRTLEDLFDFDLFSY